MESEKRVLTSTRKQILQEIQNNPYITQKELTNIIGVGITTIENNIRYLKENGYIERIGSNKTGYWQVNQQVYLLICSNYLAIRVRVLSLSNIL